MTARLVFWNVQHGNAAYLQTPSDQRIVVDLGTGDLSSGREAFSPLRHLKSNWNVHRLDAAIISHPHEDHLGDILELENFGPRVLHRPRTLPEQEVSANGRGELDVIKKYIELDKRFVHPVQEATNPLLSANNGGVSIETFGPLSMSDSNLNNHSIVTVISYGGIKILLPGDNEDKSWVQLLFRDDFKEAIKGTDILLASHHGRDAGFSENLFHHINPWLTVISDGPLGSTSRTERYAAKTRGWTVHKRRSGNREDRKCVTTRRDGVITVDFGPNRDGNGNYISVFVD